MSAGVTNSYVGGEGAASLRVLQTDLARIPKEMRRKVAPKLRQAGQETLRAAASNASWSSRIPHAMSLRAQFTGRSPGVTIVVSTDKAPHARAYEGIVAGTFKHPLFDREGPWYKQAARPYLLPAARETGGHLQVLVAQAVDEALAATGFK